MKIHPTAVISPDAKIAEGVEVLVQKPAIQTVLPKGTIKSL